MADISDDKQTDAITPKESEAEIKDKNQERMFRYVAFYGACFIVFVFLGALLTWLVWWPFHSFNLNSFAGGIDKPERYAEFINQTKHLWVTGIVILAAIPTTLALALLRFTFSAKGDKEKTSDIPGVWLSLAKEVIEVVKDYIKTKVK
ncbi:hypothetical protein [Pantoea sp. BAV 3049]|uniref:hypothetical protein n=1 Tax=Pantoea sp. BAV 3049 TaxID=2654188 RepID=UPI00131BCDB6|nr:hypothetical protein [Pantoea sp. BAV 3049]